MTRSILSTLALAGLAAGLSAAHSLAQCVPTFANVLLVPDGNPQTFWTSVAAGDFDGDGRMDLTASGGGATVRVLRGNGSGAFLALPAVSVASVQRLAAADFNRDGRLDVVAATATAVVILFGNGDGTLGAPISIPFAAAQRDIAVADFNGDGVPDLVVTTGPNSASLLLGTGTGTFVSGVSIEGIGAAYLGAADFNADGRLDLATSNGSSVWTLLGNGDGTFQVPLVLVLNAQANSLAIGDFNGDSRPDVALVADNPIALVGNGDGTLVPRYVSWNLSSASRRATVADVNGDGHPDIITADNTHSGSAPRLFLGNGDGSFRPGTNLGAAGAYQAVAADFDGDGRVDVAVGIQGIRLLTNTAGVGFTQHPARASVPIGHPATFTLAVQSNAPAKFQWRRDGVPLTDGGRVVGAQTPTLVVSSMRVADSGSSFDCIVTGGCATVRSNPAGVSVFNPCPADFDAQGGLTIDDLFDYINAWLAGCP